MAVLGSREQMCIHDEVSKLRGRAQNNACHYLCKKRWCRHHNLVAEYMRNNTELGSEPFDIEDLVNIGRTKGPELVIESKELGYTKPGSYIYEFLSELNITSETSKKLIETIDSASLLLEEGLCGKTINLRCCIGSEPPTLYKVLLKVRGSGPKVDRIFADPLKLKVTYCDDSIAPLANKCIPQEILSDSAATAVNEHLGTTLSVNATTRRSNYIKFAQITPANRSTLSMKHGCSSTSQLLSSGDQLSQDAQVVGWTADMAIHGHLAQHTFKSLGLKKAKITDRSKEAIGFDNVSSKLQHNVESRALAVYQGERSTPPSKKSSIEQACEKNEAIREKSGGQESDAGPAFLKLTKFLKLKG